MLTPGSWGRCQQRSRVRILGLAGPGQLLQARGRCLGYVPRPDSHALWPGQRAYSALEEQHKTPPAALKLGQPCPDPRFWQPAWRMPRGSHWPDVAECGPVAPNWRVVCCGVGRIYFLSRVFSE